MEVQTYIIEETSDLIHNNEALDKWNELVSSLKLDGQRKIQKPDKSPIPFLCLNNMLVEVFNVLCPQKVEIGRYDKTPIPVEILELVGLSLKEGYFKKMEVWYDDKTVDPIVLGITGIWKESAWYSDSNKSLDGKEFNSEEEAKKNGANRPYLSETGKYLLARWGDVRQSLDELRKRAKERYLSQERNEIEKTVIECNHKLELLDKETNIKFGF